MIQWFNPSKIQASEKTQKNTRRVYLQVFCRCIVKELIQCNPRKHALR